MADMPQRARKATPKASTPRSRRTTALQSENGATPASPPAAASADAIAARAYELYLARGGESGFELDDWLQAEREISARR
jgi:DUF2934 family protein